MLLPLQGLLVRYLPLFSFDNRLVTILVRKFVQTRRFSDLNMMLSFTLPSPFRIAGNIYLGCVIHDILAKVIEDDFNSLDSHLAVKIVERLATISSRFEIIEGHKGDPGSLSA
jgi:hypothetical protein